MANGYLQHARDWTITRDAIVRLTARLQRSFTYAELSAEIEEADGLTIDPRGYEGGLEAVAQHIRSEEPPWTAMVVNAETGRPGDGLWKANPLDRRYADAGRLSPESRDDWLAAQRAWSIEAALVSEDPLDSALRDREAATRERAQTCLIDLLMRDQRATR